MSVVFAFNTKTAQAAVSVGGYPWTCGAPGVPYNATISWNNVVAHPDPTFDYIPDVSNNPSWPTGSWYNKPTNATSEVALDSTWGATWATLPSWEKVLRVGTRYYTRVIGGAGYTYGNDIYIPVCTATNAPTWSGQQPSQVVSGGTYSITLNWSGGQANPTFGYYIDISTDGVNWPTGTQTWNTSYTFTGLSPSVNYYFRTYTGSHSGTSGPLNVPIAAPPSCSSATPDGDTVYSNSTRRVYANGVSNATSILFPTWSDPGGQNDLIWYPGTYDGRGTWYADIPMSNHGTGTMNTHVYLFNSNYSNVWCDTANFTSIAPLSVSISASPTSIAYNGSSTITWASTSASSCSVSPSGWTGTSGSQNTGALTSNRTYTVSCNGIAGGSTSATATVTVGAAPPSCSSATPDGDTVYSNSTRRVYANGVSNATSILFPTWSDPGGQNDLIWYPGTYDGRGTWYADINVSNHATNDPTTAMNTHVYLNNANYSDVFLDYANFMAVPRPSTADAVSNLVRVLSDTLTVDLTAVPILGSVPLSVNLTSTVGGTATGTINYYFWWDCSNTSSDHNFVEEIACGALPNPSIGSCSENARGVKCNAISNSTVVRNVVYATTGVKIPKVIVERGIAPATQDQSSVTVNPSIPTATNVTVSVNNSVYCSLGIHATVNWTYSDPVGSPQTVYEVQIDDDADPLSGQPEWESGTVNSTGTSASTTLCNTGNPVASPQTACRMTWNTSYSAWVRVQNGYGQWSSWQRMSIYINGTNPPQSVNSWITPIHAFPNTNADFYPPNPSVGSPVTFNDLTVFQGAATPRSWFWEFGDLAESDRRINAPPATNGNTTFTYTDTGAYRTALTATDDLGQSCSFNLDVFNIQPPIPEWIEVAPR